MVGHVSGMGNHVSFGDYCSLNPNAQFFGTGTIRIGDYFHTGQNLTIITMNHDFDHGEAIPYSGYIVKSVEIKSYVPQQMILDVLNYFDGRAYRTKLRAKIIVAMHRM